VIIRIEYAKTQKGIMRSVTSVTDHVSDGRFQKGRPSALTLLPSQWKTKTNDNWNSTTKKGKKQKGIETASQTTRVRSG